MLSDAFSGASNDVVQPFQVDAALLPESPEPQSTIAVRGRFVRLGPVVDDILSRHAYPEPVAGMLAEMLVLASAMAHALKYDGVFSLQARGDGPVAMMLADVTSDGALRGYAQFDDDKLAAALAEPAANVGWVPRLFGKGYLAFTVDQGKHSQLYQGVVALRGDSLADGVLHYFRQSEQVDAAIKLAVSRPAIGEGNGNGSGNGSRGHGWHAAAIMLQRIAEDGADRITELATVDAWRRLLLLMTTATDGEMLDPDLEPAALVYRLFHEDDIRIYRPRAVCHGCRCSRARARRILASLPRQEVETLRRDGRLTFTCQFCNVDYVFDENEIESIFAS
jgi:molecular chaperone Hsp33